MQALAPDTHVKAHYGPTNKKLRCHLPIHIPASASDAATAQEESAAWIRVAGETRHLTEGRAVLFDDSFLHEAANTSKEEPRIVLIVDVWHPDLSNEEVRFLEFLNNAQIKAAQRLNKLHQAHLQEQRDATLPGGTVQVEASEESGSDFFSVIQKARSAGIEQGDLAAMWGQLQ